jgi:glycosyltransferase involved in cell wall biosynthesis
VTTVSRRQTLRWLFVIYSLGGGGAERVIRHLTSRLVEEGDSVSVATYESEDGDVHRLAAGVSRRVMNVGKGDQGMAANWRRFVAIRRAIADESPDVVVSFLTRTNVLAIIAARSAGVPVIASERIDPRAQTEPWTWRLLRRTAYPLANALVVQTQSVGAWVRRMRWNRRVTVIANPVVAPRAAGLVDAAPYPFILGMGRLDRQKGFDLLIDAYAKLRDRSVHLVIAGAGPLAGDLAGQARRLGVGDRVHFPGRVADPDGLMRQAMVFALSSRYEGFPNVLTEAMSHGRAVVAFDCPSGPAEIVRDGHDGLLVRDSDSDAMATAIDRLLSDPALRDRLGSAARCTIASYALPNVCGRWRELALTVAGG